MSIPVRSHVVIGVFLVLAMVYHPGHARASSDPVKKWMVADWEISKLTDSCIGRASSMVSGSTTLFFSAAHNGISAFITNPKWKITSKEKTNVDVWIDAKIVGGTEARAFDAITVEIAIPSSLVAKFQDGDVVELDFGRAKYSFPLPYSRKGLKALLECGASYQRKDGGQVTNDEGSTITRGYKSVDEAFRARLKCSKYNINHVPVSKVTWEPTNYSDQEFKNCVRSKSTQDNLRFDIGVFDAIINLNCRYTEMDKGISPEKRKDLGFLRRAAVFGLISRIKAGADVDSELDLFNVNDVSAQELYLNEMTKNAVKSEQSAEACIHGRISRFAAAQSAKDAAEVAVDLCAPQIRRQVETQCSCLN